MLDPERPSCKSCPYWEPRDAALELIPLGHPDRDDGDGECHRNAPVGEMAVCGARIFVEPAMHAYAWPTTNAIDSCGEHPGFGAYVDAVTRRASRHV